ncbi:hypothetical protein ACFX2I_008819 [Malus domestica]|uniref:Uncharacterized protein n=1 Tax=Malus domestica TaxID=3750 RepID=A0A498IGI3_MALDO|nr:hypothetical protein DVH24_005156 [Malus domestica]
MFKSTSMFNNSRSSAHSSRFAEENDSSRPLVMSPEPLRWAPTAHNDNFITIADKTMTIVMAYEFFHFMGMAGDCNPKLTGVGSKKNRVHDDDDAEADRHKRKNGMYVDVVNDLKLEMPILML